MADHGVATPRRRPDSGPPRCAAWRASSPTGSDTAGCGWAGKRWRHPGCHAAANIAARGKTNKLQMPARLLLTAALRAWRNAVGVGRGSSQIVASRRIVLDLIFIALLILFTLVALLYERGCDRLMATDSTLNHS
jgi:hypothetical protein